MNRLIVTLKSPSLVEDPYDCNLIVSLMIFQACDLEKNNLFFFMSVQKEVLIPV